VVREVKYDIMKHKEYRKLMSTPFEELSLEDQRKRTTEFQRRMKLAKSFMIQLKDGQINDEFVNLMEVDDPMRETVETLKLKLDDTIGAEA
jgi:hypothetical protein